MYQPIWTDEQRVVYMNLRLSGFCPNCACGFHTQECGECGCLSVIPKENVA